MSIWSGDLKITVVIDVGEINNKTTVFGSRKTSHQYFIKSCTKFVIKGEMVNSESLSLLC